MERNPTNISENREDLKNIKTQMKRIPAPWLRLSLLLATHCRSGTMSNKRWAEPTKMLPKLYKSQHKIETSWPNKLFAFLSLHERSQLPARSTEKMGALVLCSCHRSPVARVGL